MSVRLLSIMAMLLFPATADAQLIRQHDPGKTRSFHGGTSQIKRSFDSDAEARRVYLEILEAAGLAGLDDRISLRASGDVANAAAFLEGQQRFIAYNARFMQEIRKRTNNYWSLVAILAHEIGHHVRFHTVIAGHNHKFELEADYQAGFILRRMGASLDDALSVFKTFPIKSTVTHPGRSDRIQMVTLGWLKAGVPNKASKSNNPIARQPVNNNKETREFEPKQFDGRIGKIHVRNNTLYEIKVTLWHPDSAAIFNSWVMSGTSKKYLKSNNAAINIGNDWGIQLGDSAIKSIGDAANWKGGEWRVTPQSFFR